MNDEPDPRNETHAFTPARIVALVAIGFLVLGLGYVRFILTAPDDEVMVPAGAQAGDLILEPCSYGTEAGSYAADCGTLVVPEDHQDQSSRLIALPVTRIRARSGDSAEPIFRLEGGPGITNMTFSAASRLADNRDVVLVGYRGVDGSVDLNCPEVVSALKGSGDFLADESHRAYTEAFTSCAERLRSNGVDIDEYTLHERVDDLEAARVGFGYDRINLISESVGTRTAMIYAWRYPDSIHRSVMIAVNTPGDFLWDPALTDDIIEYQAELCSQDAKCSSRTDDLAASMRSTASDIPSRWFLLPIKEGNVRAGSFFGLFDTTSEAAPLNVPITLDTWLTADGGSAAGFWMLSFLADVTFPESFVWGELAGAGSLDSPVVSEYYASGGDPGSILGNPGTDFIWGRGGLADVWPQNPDSADYQQIRTSDVETLLIGGTLDAATPVVNATEELLPSLTNGQQVVLAEFGHSLDFWTYQPDAANRLLNTFIDTGEVDDSLYTYRAMDYTAEITLVALGWGFAGTMVGFAALALLSLVWMAYRATTKGFGPKAGAWLRALYVPFVVGFGGWCFVVLLVMIIWPSVSLDNTLVSVLSIGVPIGMGTYWAWVQPDWSASRRTIGFWAAVGGGLLGAWIGFTSAPGLLAVITTIMGATIITNLALITLSIGWDRSPQDRGATATQSPSA